MDDAEIRLRCMEMALGQAKIEAQQNNLDRVAEIQTWFYNRITTSQPVSVDPMPTAAKGNKVKDKQPEIFR